LYYYKSGTIHKVIEVNGDYSLRYRSLTRDGIINRIHFGVEEFMKEATKLNELGIIIASFSGL
jgi:hypothetical protein